MTARLAEPDDPQRCHAEHLRERQIARWSKQYRAAQTEPIESMDPAIPTESEYVNLYRVRTGRDRIDRNEWEFCVVFSMFRLAAILQGIAKRALTGTASDAKAAGLGRRARSVADVAGCQVVALESGS